MTSMDSFGCNINILTAKFSQIPVRPGFKRNSIQHRFKHKNIGSITIEAVLREQVYMLFNCMDYIKQDGAVIYNITVDRKFMLCECTFFVNFRCLQNT